MSALITAIDPARFTALKAGDEHALEQLFRERYPALVADATRMLDGNGASAARAVIDVFADLWHARTDLATPDAIDAELLSAVHDAAARMQSRHAVAHQLSEFEGVQSHAPSRRAAPSVDAAWADLHRVIHHDGAQHAAAAHTAAAHSRHSAAEQIVEMARPRPRAPKIALIVVVLGALTAITWWANRARESRALTAALAAADARTTGTGMAELSTLTLSDNTSVKLGPDSRLVIPRAFTASVRGVKLEGTATFTVAPGERRNFIVRAGAASFTATGTVFTVRAYSDEPDVTMRVDEGNVSVSVGDSARALTAGESIVVTRSGALRSPTDAELVQALGWTNGLVVAEDRPLRDILVLAKRWFDITLFVPDTTLLGRPASLRAELGMGVDAVASIEASSGLTRVREGTNMVLEDHAARPRPRPPTTRR